MGTTCEGEEEDCDFICFLFLRMEGAALPQGGKLSILCNSKNEAECIMLTTKVYTTSFNLISKKHAYKEGEGNQS